jgi:ketosteroid isomerase-like protein
MHRNGLGRFGARGWLTARASAAALGIGAVLAVPGQAAAADIGREPAMDTAKESAAMTKREGEAAKAAIATVERFERALADGDRTAALNTLSQDLVVFESGHAERSREEYAASHLDADIAFLKTAKTRLLSRITSAVGDTVAVLSETEIRSERDGKATTRASLETLLLRRTVDGWRITHIHWSSRVE